jgi:hypothetical protein
MEFDLDNLTAEVKDLITKLTKEITDKMVVKEWRKR